MTPIFIFSLPRSGSTLLQKIVASSKDVATSAEPWVLLPLVYMQKTDGTLTDYSHRMSLKALAQIKDDLKSNDVEFSDLIREYVTAVYSGLAGEQTKYFLDKTPRYYLIIDELYRLFPDAKFIFLFRNPLEQFASKLATHKGRFKTLHSAAVDLFKGPRFLAEGYKNLERRSVKICYSDLVSSPEKVIEELETYLSVSIDKHILTNLTSVQFSGEMGDPSLMSKTRQNDRVSTVSLGKWKRTFNSPLRKAIARKYLNRVDELYFECLGVDRESILKELNSIPVLWLKYPYDCVDLIYFGLSALLKPYIFFQKRING